MSALISIKDFVFINKRFLDKDDNLEITTNLSTPKPCNVYLNKELYSEKVSLQRDIPLVISNTALNFGYNEIKITADVNTIIIFGITNGYNNDCNTIEHENCQVNTVENKVYISGNDQPSTITINSKPDINMNNILNIANVFGNELTIKDMIDSSELGPIGSGKLCYEDILGNIDEVITNSNISNFKYFRIEIETDINSETKYFRPLNDTGNAFDKASDLFIITDHNFKTDINEYDNFLFGNIEDSQILPSDDNISYFEFTTNTPIYGFNINHTSTTRVKIFGKEKLEDTFNLIFNIVHPDTFDITLNTFSNNAYITAFEYNGEVYILSPYTTESNLVSLGSENTQIEEYMRYLPPIPDSYIKTFITDGTTNINNIIMYENVQSLKLKSDNVDYGIAVELDGKYFDELGGLSDDLYLFNPSNIDIQIYPSNATIIYYIKSKLPIIVEIKEHPYASYFIKNKINIAEFNLSTDNIHSETVTMNALINNEFNKKMYVDIYLNDIPSNTILIESNEAISNEYNYNTPNIKTSQNTIYINIKDMLGNTLESEKIIFTFNNDKPTIIFKVHDFYLTGTINDAEGDKVSYDIYINDELVSYNNPFKQTPYTFKYEWDNFKYNTGDNISIEMKAMDEYGGITSTKTNTKIVDKGIIILDEFGRQITNQGMKNIVEFNIGAIISNNPPTKPFRFKIKNMTGYPINNIVISNNTKKSDPSKAAISMAILTELDYYTYHRNILEVPNMKIGETKTILFTILGSDAPGKMDASIILEINANIR